MSLGLERSGALPVPKEIFSTISISVKALMLQKESRTWTKASQDTSSDSSSPGFWSRLWSSPEIRALSLKPCCLYLFKMHGLILSPVNTCIFPGALLYTFSGGKSVFSHIGLKWEESSSSLHISLDWIRVWSYQHLPVSYCYKEAPGFPGGAVVENLPANAGDTGSSPGLGRSHMPWSN